MEVSQQNPTEATANTVTFKALNIVGIQVRTTNGKGQAAKDIPALWHRFMEEGIAAKIPNKVDETIYGVYTDYEGDHTNPYTLIIGYEVSSLDNIPEEFSVKIIPESTYAKFTAQGDLTKEAVIGTWMQIWNAPLDRKYTADIEVYDDRAADPTNGVADVLIAI
ncbi:GyrI-like domain-containing protein [Wenyingzhuangia sp. IMCC45574]